MTTRKVTKLLAVVAFATSPATADPTPRAPIAARVEVPHVPAAPDPWASPAIVTFAVPHPATAAPLSLTALVARLVSPRTMPSGAPACGNVASRAPEPIDCERRTR